MKLKIGQSASVSKTFTEFDVYGFAGICGDFNPLHVNEVEAEKSIFGKRVCHGMLVASMISTVLSMYLPGKGTISLEQGTKFLAPTFIGDTVTATATIVDIQNEIITLETSVINQDGKQVLSGQAKVMVNR